MLFYHSPAIASYTDACIASSYIAIAWALDGYALGPMHIAI